MNKQNSAVKTLEALGYTYSGGELWKPPVGKEPDFNLIDKLNARIKELDGECDRCQMLEVKIEQLHARMAGWDKTEAEIKKEAVEDFMYQLMQNQYYNKEMILDFYRRYLDGSSK